MKAEQKYYVYTLAKPDGTVFYVGKGSGDRMNDHVRNARKGVQSHTCHTIRKIWNSDCKIIQTKVAFFEVESEAYEFEKTLIAFFGGRENLTNLTDGGDGGGTGRPKTLTGDYVTIALAIRKDLLAEIDASGKSRREYIEQLLSHK